MLVQFLPIRPMGVACGRRFKVDECKESDFVASTRAITYTHARGEGGSYCL